MHSGSIATALGMLQVSCWSSDDEDSVGGFDNASKTLKHCYGADKDG